MILFISIGDFCGWSLFVCFFWGCPNSFLLLNLNNYFIIKNPEMRILGMRCLVKKSSFLLNHFFSIDFESFLMLISQVIQEKTSFIEKKKSKKITNKSFFHFVYFFFGKNFGRREEKIYRFFFELKNFKKDFLLLNLSFLFHIY